MLMKSEEHLAIDIRDLNKHFGRHHALNNISLRVSPGDMIALIGPSGSGKSTLLRHIAGLITSDRSKEGGQITVFGRTVQNNGRLTHDIRSIRSDIGFIFQQFNLVGRMSLIKNVTVGMLSRVHPLRSLLGLFTRKEKKAAMKSLHRVGLAKHAAQRASTLSGGQQQRAAIARTMEQKAKIILADEPIASLDPESARMVMDSLKQMNENDEVTVLVSLHQVQFALKYCGRSIALKNGHVVYDGPSSRLTTDMLRQIYGSKFSECLMDGTSQIQSSPEVPRIKTEEMCLT